MNVFNRFSDVLFTCVDAPPATVADTFLSAFNKPNESSPRDEHGMPIIQYFTKQVEQIEPLPYQDKADRDTRKTKRIVFWEPVARPGTTVLMGRSHDGLNYSVYRLSQHSPFTWINVRVYDDLDYAGCCLDFYSDHRKTMRRVAALYDEDGWTFNQEGEVQPFENVSYYSRNAIRERLNREIVVEYMAKNGCVVTDDDFWEAAGPAVLLWQERPPKKT